jgi:hypothetical protein
VSNRVISSTGSLTGYSAAVSIDAANDYMLLQQSGSYKKLNRNTLLGITGTPADISTAQNFTNKVLDNTNTITLKDTLFTLQDDGDTTKQAKFQLSGITTGTTRTYTLPNASSTLMDLGSAQTVTGVKTMTAPVISGGSIDNTTITVDSIAEHTAANGVSIDSLNIKDGKLNTNNSVVTANITDAAVTPAKLVVGTGTGWAWSSWTPTWTNLTVGNGTVSAKYIQIGKAVFYRIYIILGNTSAVGTGPTFTVPVASSTDTASQGILPIGRAYYLDAGATNYMGAVQLINSTVAAWTIETAGSTYVQLGQVTAAVPFAFGNLDILMSEGFYEAA